MKRLLLMALLALAVGVLMLWSAAGVDPQESISPDVESGASAQPSLELRSSPRALASDGPTTADRERRGDALDQHGRAEDWLTGEGLSGARLTFERHGETVEVQSAADGSFTPPPRTGEELLAVAVQPPEGFWTLEHGPRARAGAQLYVARFAPHTHGPLRAQLVDILTGEALPDYIVELRGEDGWSETVQTDAEGQLRTDVLFRAGTLDLWSTQEERGETFAEDALGHLEFSPGGAAPAPLSVAIESGPTYKLQLVLPEGLEASRLSAYIESADWVDQLEPEFHPGQRLRQGSPLWVRFPEDQSWKSNPRLVLLGPEGRWKGVAEVDASPGRHVTPIHIRVERQAQLLGKVLDAEGNEVARAEVELTPNDENGALFSRWTLTNGRGNFVIEGLAPGSYSLGVRHFTAGALAQQIEVGTSADERERFQLEPFLAAGELAGIVRSSSGDFHASAQVLLLPRDSESAEFTPRRSQRLEWTLEGGEHVARFRFVQVALAEYDVRILAPRLPFLVEPGDLSTAPPNENLELTIRDDREVFSLSFLPLDAETGRWLSETQLQLRDASGTELYAGPTSGWSSPRPFGEEEVLSWRLSKDGYVTARGDRSSFASPLGARVQQAVVRLRRH